MGFISLIIEAFNTASHWFYRAYLDAYYSGWIPYVVVQAFYNLSSICSALAWQFYYFGQWLDAAEAKLREALSWDTIWDYILGQIPNLTQMRDWFYGWLASVLDVVGDWWAATQITVQGWISSATEGLADLRAAWSQFWAVTWPDFTVRLATLGAAWTYFWTSTLPDLVSFAHLSAWWSSRLLDVSALIDSAFNGRSSLWAGWRECSWGVIDFLGNPVGYVWDRFLDWFLSAEA